MQRADSRSIFAKTSSKPKVGAWYSSAQTVTLQSVQLTESGSSPQVRANCSASAPVSEW